MSEPNKPTFLKLNLSVRDFKLLLAGLMAVEDAPDAFRVGLATLGEKPAHDREVVALGERILEQMEPQ